MDKQYLKGVLDSLVYEFFEAQSEGYTSSFHIWLSQNSMRLGEIVLADILGAYTSKDIEQFTE